MATPQHDLDAFTRFVHLHSGTGEADLSLDELFDLWRHENPSDAQFSENVAAIAASIEDFRRGERGAIAGEHSAELRRKFGLSER